jgi:predicted metal-dependent peptidase
LGSTRSCRPPFVAELVGPVASLGQSEVLVLRRDVAIPPGETVRDAALQPLEPIAAVGGAATDFSAVFDYFEPHEAYEMCDALPTLRYLTDGCSTSPVVAAPCPVQWMTTPRGGAPVPSGETV